jgi:hypothetical protein
MTTTAPKFATTTVPAVVVSFPWMGDMAALLQPHGLQIQVPINTGHLCIWTLDGWGCCESRNARIKR